MTLLLYPNGEFSLGLSTPVKSHKPPEPSSSRERSGKPQTTYSKKMVRNCVHRLERLYGRRNLAFATYTLPDLNEAEMELLATNWGEVTRQLMQAIGRDQNRMGIVAEQVYVNEIQESRYKESGAIALHIHVVFQSRKTVNESYAISLKRNTQIWNRVVSNVLGRDIEIPFGARIEQVKKSAERYMSKYMSKGSSLAQKVADEGKKHLLPKQWWGATLTLRRWVKENTRLLSDDAKEFIRENYRNFLDNLKESPFSWLYVHVVTLLEPHGEEVEIPVAIVGKIRTAWLDAFECKNLSISW